MTVEARVQRHIRAYVDHLDDAEYCRDVGMLADVQTVSAVLVAMLRSGERSAVNDALLFICDVVGRRMVPALVDDLSQSRRIGALRPLMYAQDQNVRHNVIHTLGKMGPAENARLLVEAFPYYLDRYPLELPDLLQELFWLSREESRRSWEYYDRVAASPSHLIRWSLVQNIEKCHSTRLDGEIAQRLHRLYDALSQDANALVAAEATHQLARLRLNLEAPSLPRPELRKRQKRLRRTEPSCTFIDLKVRFWNYLSAVDRADYDLATLDAFARYQALRPVTANADLTAHARAFDAWRRQSDATDPPP